MNQRRIASRTPRLTMAFGWAMAAAVLAGGLVGAATPQALVSPWESAQVPDSVRSSKPWQRAVWAWEERAYPDIDIPPGARLRAFDQIRAYRVQNPQLRTAANWTSVGPTPLENRAADTFTAKTSVSGRVSAIAVNPRKKKEIIIGTAQGGIHVSTNGGRTWKSAGDDLMTLAIGSIAYAPGNTKTIYAGTGENVFSGDAYAGVGVYKSTNGGTTWKLINKTDLTGINIGALIVNPKNEDHVLFSSSGFGNRQSSSRQAVGVYRSIDGGVTWSLQLAGHATDLVADAKDFDNQYAGLGNIFGAVANGVYRSTDAGVTWSKLSGPWDNSLLGRIELAVAPSKRDVLYVGIQDSATFGLHGLFKSTNASGREEARAPDFEEIEIPKLGSGHGEDTYCGGQCWYDHVLVVDPKKPDTLWAGGIFLWRLEKGAWEMMLPGHVDVHALAFSGKKQLFVGNDGGIFSTKNGGDTWASHNDGLTLTQFYHGSISDLDFLLGGTQDNGTSTRDAGTARRAGEPWTRVLGGDGADNEISVSDPANDWAVSFQNLGLRRTTDGGATFQVATGGINVGEAPFIAVFAKCPGNDDVFYAGTDRVWKATNFFSTAGVPNWKDQGPKLDDGDTVRAVAVSAADPKCNTVAMATARGEIFYSKNGGKKWNNADKRKQVPGRRITDLAFDPQDKNTLTLTLSGFDESGAGDPGHVFRTTQANKSKPKWTDISPPVNLPFQAVEYQPGGTAKLWVGSDLGVWEQIGGARGAQWIHHGPDTGLPNVAVFDLRATADGVVAFTHGRGAWVLSQAAPRSR